MARAESRKRDKDQPHCSSLIGLEETLEGFLANHIQSGGCQGGMDVLLVLYSDGTEMDDWREVLGGAGSRYQLPRFSEHGGQLC